MKQGSPTLLHRLRHTPLTDMLRGRVTARLDWRGMIERSDLPAPLRELVMLVVRRTRLWRSERVEVAQELVAHFHDGLHAGRTAEQLVAGFGDPRVAAKLIRRGKVRNRPLAWHAARRATQAAGVFMLVYVVAGLLLLTVKPSPSVDYAALLNAREDAATADQKAWPVYREAWIEHDLWRIDDEGLMVQTGTGKRYPVPGEPGWDLVREMLAKRRSLIDATRRGAEKPFTGMRAGSYDNLSEDEAIALFGPAEAKKHLADRPAKEQNRLVADSLYHFLLPSLGIFRKAAGLLDLDLQDAADQRDSSRVVADFRAMLGLAKQTRGRLTLIEQLVAISIERLAVEALAGALQHNPDAITDADLVTLAGLLSEYAAINRVEFFTERMCFLDMVQRVYSDNGRGGGIVTLDGLQFFKSINGSQTSQADIPALVGVLVLPLAATVTVGRRELIEKFDEVTSLWDQDSRLPLWEVLQGKSRSDSAVLSMREGLWTRLRFNMLTTMVPSIVAVFRTTRMEQARREAVGVAIALEKRRRRTGTYPATLAELVPGELSQTPIDHSTGEPLLMKFVDGKPLLYGRGKNKVDDGGTLAAIRPGVARSEIPFEGDWILYPPVIEPMTAPATQPAPP